MESWNFSSLVHLNNAPLFHHCEPGWHWAPPPLTDYDLWWVLEGRGRFHLGDRSFDLRPGRCFVLRPASQIQASQDPVYRLLVFAVHFEPLDPAHFPDFPVEGQLVRDRELLEILARRCESFYQRGDEAGRQQSTGLLRQILLQLADELRQPLLSAADRSLNEIMQIIRLEPGRRWKVEELAGRAGLSRSQFTRRFQQLAGRPPNAFVMQTRLERARHLLLETDMTIAGIAEALGYPDIYFFSRQFKAATGLAPSELRGAVVRSQ
jgi:AraC-like DNA-binding protein